LNFIQKMKKKERIAGLAWFFLVCLTIGDLAVFCRPSHGEPNFPNWSQAPAEIQKFFSLAVQRHDETASGAFLDDDTARIASFNPLLLVKFSQADAAMIGTTTPPTDQGLSTYGTSAQISAVFFKKNGDHWVRRSGLRTIGESGFGGFAGTMSARRLMGGQVDVDIISESCSQGTCGKWLSVIRLKPADARMVGDRISLAADNVAAKEGCDGALESAMKEAVAQNDTPTIRNATAPGTRLSSPEMDGCFRITGEPQFSQSGTRLRIYFREQFLNADLRNYHQNNSIVEYSLSHEKYILITGLNPVPKL
jgi:hypothetical protein